MHEPRETARDVFGKRAGYYTTSAVHRDAAALAALVSLVEPQSDWAVVDVATGTGHTALAFAPHVRRVLAADVTREMLGEARTLATQQGVPNVDLCQADAHSLPVADRSMDLVTCRRAAHHFADLPTALAEMHRLLRPGGLLLIEDRSIPEDDRVDLTMNRLGRLHDPSHVREYRASEWRRYLQDAGFAVHSLEVVTRQRPLASLTDNASPEAAAEIAAIIDGLSEAEGDVLGLNVAPDANGVGREPYTNHWYVTALAEKR